MAEAPVARASGGVTFALFATWRNPRGVMAEVLDRGGEAHSLFCLMMACTLLFVASTPDAIRTARIIDANEPLSAAIGAHLFGFFFVAPLLLYGVGVLAHIGARAFGGRGTFAAARAALFWSLLTIGPVALALAVFGVFAETSAAVLLPWLQLLGYAGLAFWLWIFASCLAEAEGFRHSGKVTAVVLGAFGLIAALLALISGAPASATG